MVYRRVLFGVAVCMAASSVGASYESVTGKELEKCSMPGMALTGYTRQGKCVAHDDDAGSHHVCIDMASNTGGNFCSVTGQPDWCSSKMACDNASGTCPVEHWCVCEWAFARYIQKAGGCDKIQKIVCDATNMKALQHYEAKKSDPNIKVALDCLKSRCLNDGQ